MGMTDSQYKELLLDAKEDWTELLKLLEPLDTPEAEKARVWARQKVEKIDEKLKM